MVDIDYFRKRQKLIELRYNPYHDPSNGRFTSGGGGGGGGSVLMIPKGHKGVYKGYKKELAKSSMAAGKMAAERIKAMGGTADEWGNYNYAEHGGLKRIAGAGSQTPTATINVQTGNVTSQATNSGNGLTNSGNSGTMDKTVRDSNSSLSKAIGKDRYEQVCTQIDSCQNENLRKLYRDNINQTTVTYDPNAKSSYQKNGANEIALDELGENTTRGRSKNSVVHHEEAHAIDNQCGGGGVGQYYSKSWNNGAFGKGLTAEVDSYVGSRDKQLKAEFSSHQNDAGWLRKHAYPAGWQVPGTTDEYIISYCQRIYPKYSKKIAYQSVKNEVSTLLVSGDTSTSHQAGCVSDIFGCATNNRARDGMGHSDAYVKRSSALPLETFAEFSECTVAGHTDVLKKYFPASYSNYEKMVSEAASK